MTTATATLTEFLLACIAEDEEEAKAAIHEYATCPPLAYDMAQVPMLAAGDPDRVLAECEAKRRIVELAWNDFGEEGDPYDDGIRSGREMFRDAALRLLALPYADRPGFREEWRA